MKDYSANAVTKDLVDSTIQTAVESATSAIDAKQTRQIKQLQLYITCSFVFNLVLAIGAYLK